MTTKYLDGVQQVELSGSIVTLNEPSVGTVVAAGQTLDVTVDLSNCITYDVLFTCEAGHTYSISTRFLKNTGALITSGLDEYLVANAANPYAIKNGPTVVKTPKQTIRYTNNDAVSHTVYLYVYGRKG
jgi:hypothetical protein